MKGYCVALLGLLIPLAGLLAGFPGLPVQARRTEVRQAVLDQPLPVPREEGATSTSPSIVLFDRKGQVVPTRKCCQHTGGGNIEVTRNGADTVIIAMKGVAVARAHPWHDTVAALDFDVAQDFQIALEKAEGKKLALAMEARVIGALRTSSGGHSAEQSGSAGITMGLHKIFALPTPSHVIGSGDSLSINDHVGPVTVPVVPGKYTLHQSFRVAVSHARSCCPCKASSAEFAPDPALDPLWISYWEPFHGANKKDFGFQVAIKAFVE